MPPVIYEVARLGNGILSIMAKPNLGGGIVQEFSGLKYLGIDKLVSLLEVEEARVLGLAAEGQLCADNDMEFEQFPIKDFGLPETIAARNFAKSLYDQINNGQHIVVHCRGGIGRSGMIAGAILREDGKSASNAFDIISQARCERVPDTDEQIGWLENY